MAIGISLLPDPKPKHPSDPDPERKICGPAVERVVFDPRIYPQTLRPTDSQYLRLTQTTFVGIAEEHASPARSLVAYRNSETRGAEDG